MLPKLYHNLYPSFTLLLYGFVKSLLPKSPFHVGFSCGLCELGFLASFNGLQIRKKFDIYSKFKRRRADMVRLKAIGKRTK